MEKLHRVLQFLRITDDQNNLSLTNIALMAALGRLLTDPHVDLAGLAPFVATLVSYQVKRFAAGLSGTPADDETEQLKEALKSLQTKVTGLELGQQRPRL